MDGLRHIQVGTGMEAGATEFPVCVEQAGAVSAAPGSQLEPVGGNFAIQGIELLPSGTPACPELWEQAQEVFKRARAERDPVKHHALLLEAAAKFGDVALASGFFPEEKSYALNNIGLICQALNRLEHANKAFGLALMLNPKDGIIMQNYATIRMCMDDLKGADEMLYKALEKDPNCPEARWNSSLLALLFGDFRRGFINYEWRWRCGQFTWRKLKTSRPQWNGQDLKGKTVLLTHEQGFGDSIMMIRYAKMVKARGAARVRYLCLPELICILKDVEGIDSVTEFADINQDGTAGDEDFDYHCPLLSLPRIFKTRKDSVPWDGPYIKIDSGKRTKCDCGELLKRQDGSRPYCIQCGNCYCKSCNGSGHVLSHSINDKPYPNPRIGIVWAGRREHGNDKKRSMKLKDFAPLFEVPGINWYSLQVARNGDLVDFPQIYSPPLKTFADTAWWLNELDLLISVDTAVVHLAGAMGRPIWALLPFSPDWRWMLDRDDSPWYPSMRLFRQSEKRDWAEVIENVKQQLIERVKSCRC